MFALEVFWTWGHGWPEDDTYQETVAVFTSIEAAKAAVAQAFPRQIWLWQPKGSVLSAQWHKKLYFVVWTIRPVPADPQILLPANHTLIDFIGDR